MKMLYLTEEDVRRYLPMGDCIELMQTVFQRLATGEALNHPRRRLILPTHSVLHYMAGSDGKYINIIHLIVGSVATGRGSLAMDSLPPMLRVLQTDSAAFYGSWMGSIGGIESSGHFCALRVRGI